MIPKLTDCEWAIIEYLQGRAWVDSETLSAMTAAVSRRFDHAAAPRKVRTIHVHVFNIREKLGDGAILHVPDRGYLLGAPGVKYYRARKAADDAMAEGMK